MQGGITLAQAEMGELLLSFFLFLVITDLGLGLQCVALELS